jgi:hypothetical protein
MTRDMQTCVLLFIYLGSRGVGLTSCQSPCLTLYGVAPALVAVFHIKSPLKLPVTTTLRRVAQRRRRCFLS